MTDTSSASLSTDSAQSGRKKVRPAGTAKPANGDVASPVTPQIMVLDFGKRRGRSIKRLRKGKGPLLARLNATLDEFVRADMMPPLTPVVVVVVKKRKKCGGLFK